MSDPDKVGERFAISPDEDEIAVRSYGGDSWFVAKFNQVKGRRLDEIPDDWTYFVPATSRDVAGETLTHMLDEMESIAGELRYLRRRLPPPPDDEREALLALGARVKQARAEAGLSLRALGAKIGVPFNTLSRVERGGAASADNVARIMDWLVGRTGEGAQHG